jgi:hypothetical protein
MKKRNGWSGVQFQPFPFNKSVIWGCAKKDIFLSFPLSMTECWHGIKAVQIAYFRDSYLIPVKCHGPFVVICQRSDLGSAKFYHFGEQMVAYYYWVGKIKIDVQLTTRLAGEHTSIKLLECP